MLGRDSDGMVMRSYLESLMIQLGAHPPTQVKVSLILSGADAEDDGYICLEELTMARTGVAAE